ncbi:hypothetical protein [uncultured Chitinophaga sp.]|uniref:hypothetical protein n=1 Tax=uncultured Chitinophaga sp. TaxID=339340 RepID=UPI0026256964|nr:hypothetical protein [uncultured Chitinophaga sp.]
MPLITETDIERSTERIRQELKKEGFIKFATCDSGEDKQQHFVMLHLLANTPADMSIYHNKEDQVYDWCILPIISD